MRLCKKILSILLSIVMIISVFAAVPDAVAGAAEATGSIFKRVKSEPVSGCNDTSYIDLNGRSQDTRAIPVTKDTAEFNGDWYVADQSLTVNGRIVVKGDANLILGDDKTLTLPKGICVNDGASLTIWAQSEGSGALIIDNVDNFNAGIGGDDRVDSGVITINGGVINVTAGLYAAGIGGGYRAKGTVAINGGSIYADGQGSPSIGGGNFGFGSQVTLDWRSASDSIFADSYSGTVTLKRAFFTDGRILHNGEVSDLSSIDGRTIVPHVHSFTHSAYQAATEYAAGNIEYWSCSVCGGHYTDEDGYYEVTQADTVIPMLSIPLSEGAYPAGVSFDVAAGTSITGADGSSVTFEENTTLSLTFSDNVLKLGDTAVDELSDNGMAFTGYCIVAADSDSYTIKMLYYADGVSAAVWAWDGYSAAQVTLGNLYYTGQDNSNPADLTVTLDADITAQSGETSGETIYTATATSGDCTFTDSRTERNITKRFVKHSLSLNGDIGVNFFLDLTADEIAQGAKVDFAWLDKTDSVTLTAAHYKADQELYKVTCNVCAPEMADDITAVLTIGGEEAETDHYSVKTYADVILADDDRPEVLKSLVRAMLNYGGCTQIQFEDEHPDNTRTANEGLDAPAALTPDEISAINTEIPDKEAFIPATAGSGLTYHGYTMLLHTMTSLRFYFQKDSPDTDISGIRLGKNAAKNCSDTLACVEVKGIPAYELDYAYDLSVNGTPLGSYSALTYVKNVLTSGSPDEALIDTVTAMYRYHKAAVAYFSNNK